MVDTTRSEKGPRQAPRDCTARVSHSNSKGLSRAAVGIALTSPKHFAQTGDSQLRSSPIIASSHPTCIAFFYLPARLIVYRAWKTAGAGPCKPKHSSTEELLNHCIFASDVYCIFLFASPFDIVSVVGWCMALL